MKILKHFPQVAPSNIQLLAYIWGQRQLLHTFHFHKMAKLYEEILQAHPWFLRVRQTYQEPWTVDVWNILKDLNIVKRLWL